MTIDRAQQSLFSSFLFNHHQTLNTVLILGIRFILRHTGAIGVKEAWTINLALKKMKSNKFIPFKKHKYLWKFCKDKPYLLHETPLFS